MSACLMTIAEDRHERLHEIADNLREQAFEHLKSEFVRGASMPLHCTLDTPIQRDPHLRSPYLAEFFDRLTWTESNRFLQARVVALVVEHAPDVLEELARQHAESYADGVAQ